MLTRSISFYSLLHLHSDLAEIVDRIVELYPESDRASYMHALQGLWPVEPHTDDDNSVWFLLVEEIPEPFAREETYWHVSGIGPPAADGWFPLAMEFSPWQEWLALPVISETDELSTLAHLLWEMTFHGIRRSL